MPAHWCFHRSGLPSISARCTNRHAEHFWTMRTISMFRRMRTVSAATSSLAKICLRQISDFSTFPQALFTRDLLFNFLEIYISCCDECCGFVEMRFFCGFAVSHCPNDSCFERAIVMRHLFAAEDLWKSLWKCENYFFFSKTAFGGLWNKMASRPA